MVAVQRGLLLTPELRSVFDYTIIDPNSLLVELDKFAALGELSRCPQLNLHALITKPGDSLYIFAISLLLYRVIRQRSSRSGSRILKRNAHANAGIEGTQQLLVAQTPSPPPYHVPVILAPQPATSFIPYNFDLECSKPTETPKPEISLTSVIVDFATPDTHNNGDTQPSLVELTECDAHDESINRALAVGVGERDIDNGPDNDLNINDSNADISLTTATFHLVVLLARTLDSSHSATHLTLFRRLIVKYEYTVTLLTIVIVLLRCRKRYALIPSAALITIANIEVPSVLFSL
jgi:hypothetical protein